jgi:post-segregation antitoxin (ccd killing protein)
MDSDKPAAAAIAAEVPRMRALLGQQKFAEALAALNRYRDA